MADEQDIPAPEVQDEPQVPVDTPAPQRKMYDLLIKGQLYSKSFDDFQKQYSKPEDIDKLYNGLNSAQLYSKSKDDFYKQYFPSPAQQTDPIQDLRKLNQQANQPIRQEVSTIDPMSGGTSVSDNQEDVARNKGFQQQYEQGINNLASNWGTDAKTTKQVFSDFGDEGREDKLKGYVDLAKNNPVYYSRLKDANDIRTTIAKAGPEGVHDANIFNDLQQSGSYDELQHNIAMQQEILTKYGLGQQYFEKLKNTQSPLINTVDPGLNMQYWNSDDHKLGLSIHQYAGLQTEKMFNPGKYQEDLNIIRENKGLDEGGNLRPEGQGKRGYEYDRGVENVLFNLERQGRQNDYKFISQRRSELKEQPKELQQKYQDYLNSTSDPMLIKHFQEEYNANPIIQEARRIDDAQQALEYSNSEDERRFPLNYSDQATRLVKDAMDGTSGIIGDSGKWIGNVVTGAGESGDNTVRFIKNSLINLLGSQDAKAIQHAKDIGHQSLTELSTYKPKSYTGTESPLLIPDELTKEVQGVFDDSSLSSSEKEKKAFSLIQENSDQIKINPKSGQQNLTGKSMAFTAANTVGQILGIADQSMLMGGLLGDAAKAKQMANTLIPMYASTQNQLYEQALTRGDEKPLLKSSLDAAIISLASLINPDIKIVKGMVGAETGMGKLIAGVDESAWNKVLSENRPLVDRMIAGTKATARQLGLANLQYGLIVPTAQYLVHKNVLNEDPNLGDMLKDGIIQTNITMAIPALAHGIWGAVKATNVNPMQKYSIMEAGLHPRENIDLIDGQIERGQITPDKGAQIKETIKQTGEILKNTEFVKTDGTPMNEQEVADVTYNMLRKKALEGKLRNAPDPQKPLIENQIHEVDKDISDLHTSYEQKHKTELNTLLSDNLERIKRNMPAFEGPIKDAIAENRPEEVMQMIADQATETTKVDGKEVSSRSATEEIFGKELVDKAIELQKKKPDPAIEHTESYAGVKNIKLKDNAIQEPSTSGILQHPQEGNGGEGGGRERMESGEQGATPPGESGQQGSQAEGGGDNGPKKEVDPNALPFGRSDNIGIAHEYQQERAHDLKVSPTERGEGITLEQSIQRGRDLIAQGVDAQEVFNNFQKDGRISWEDMSVVRARNEQLAREANAAVDQHGDNSPEANEAIQKERDWYSKAAKPMQTEWSKIGMTQQGKTDLDTGSVTSIKRAFQEQSGKPLTDKQNEIAKELHSKIKEQDGKIEKLQDQLDKLINKEQGETTEKGIKEKSKNIAKRIRENVKLNRPGSFSAATPASLLWDTAVEIVAKSIEAGGTIAEAIGKGIDHIRESDWYKGLAPEQKIKSEKEFSDWHNDAYNGKIDVKTHFVDKENDSFTPGESKALWEHAKEIIKEGKTDFHDVINQVGMDTGLSNEQVRRAISQPKGAKIVTDKMYAEMYHRSQVLQSAKIWVKSADQSATRKFWSKVIKVPAAIVTALHGSVAPITHVGGDLYRPSNWKSYFNFMLNSYTFSFGGLTEGGKARYEKAMGDLVRDPSYMLAKKAGLRIDPTDFSSDDYSNYQSVFGRLAKMGERGFNAMKPYRLEQFKQQYNKLSDQAKANPDVVKAIAHMVNLSSGTTEAKIPPGTDLVMFAPKLVVSQYQRIFTEPAKAVGTFVKWGASLSNPDKFSPPTAAEKLQAKMVARHSGEMVATYLAALAANQAILSLSGSKQKINFTDPLSPDWMKFKAWGKDIDASGGMNSALRFVGSLVEEAARANGIVKTKEKGKPGDTEGRKIIQQMANKLSPAAGDIVEVFSGTDNVGNSLPWSSVKHSKGKEKLSWAKYFESKSPIFIAEGFKTFNEAAAQNGVPHAVLDNYLEGILIGVLAGTTGAHISSDNPKKHK